MTSYNMVNNLHMSLNKFLLQNILRDEFKFKGLTITDYGATINRDIEFEAGIDIDMPGGQKHNRKLMKKAIKNDAIDINKVDDTINKVITLMNDKKKKQFVYLRRYKTELKQAMMKNDSPIFFDQIKSDPDLKGHKLTNKHNVMMIDNEICGYAMPLSVANILKSSTYENVGLNL